ncbi:hypothetical protein RB517 [Rhodopirellula baltica SH 1]|uniref:Uncharacterized protein n=1 Tax=Rhodopirellula baltica (strain DSM 10527 / NCIMB 13988 / SH1) TaxID=243090 RepID=Q7UYL7_RHOBA|nr:hypothetical protein RB517 [Rhodopirellula baltica SH 1]
MPYRTDGGANCPVQQLCSCIRNDIQFGAVFIAGSMVDSRSARVDSSNDELIERSRDR